MKKIAMFMLALLLTVLPAAAVQAAAQKNVILNSDDGKVEIYIELPDTAVQVSTLRLRVRIEGDIDQMDQKNPLIFQLDDEISSTLLETRYNASTKMYSIYLSDTSKLTDKTEFRLGSLTADAPSGTTYSLTITVEEDGLEFVDGTGQLNQEKTAAAVSAGLQVQAPENNGDGSAGDEGNSSGNESGSGVENGTGTNGGSGDGSGMGNAFGENGDTVQQTDGQTDHIQAVTKTGDNSNILPYTVLLGVAAAGIVAILVIRKRKNR